MKAVRLVMVAVGGQGNLLAAHVLGQAALESSVPVHMSEIHGMAQRGGVVESAMVFGEAESPIISDGCADVLLGFEPAETLRALNRANPATTVITSTSPLPPFTAALGKGKYPEMGTILSLLKEKTARVIPLDAAALARRAGNPLAANMVLLGALCRTELVPVTKEAVLAAMETHTKKSFLPANREAFSLGFEAAA
ncbi:MAG: indolepyruvate oxidoreductase subunit beta [Thermodesulfobacteriota bacterium]